MSNDSTRALVLDGVSFGLTNVRVVPDRGSSNGYRLQVERFPGG